MLPLKSVCRSHEKPDRQQLGLSELRIHSAPPLPERPSGRERRLLSPVQAEILLLRSNSPPDPKHQRIRTADMRGCPNVAVYAFAQRVEGCWNHRRPDPLMIRHPIAPTSGSARAARHAGGLRPMEESKRG